MMTVIFRLWERSVTNKYHQHGSFECKASSLIAKNYVNDEKVGSSGGDFASEYTFIHHEKVASSGGNGQPQVLCVAHIQAPSLPLVPGPIIATFLV